MKPPRSSRPRVKPRHDASRDALALPAAADETARRPRRDAATRAQTARLNSQFVVALARGLEVLSAFRPGEGPLGNQELADRTGLPKPTISRLSYTLIKLGFLTYNQRATNYELGGAALRLGYTALASINVRRVARPAMQRLADLGNCNVGLGVRDRQMMIYADTCEGTSLVGLRLHPGSRIPMATTAMGRAYLAGLPEGERDGVFDELRRQHGKEWPAIRKAIERAMREIVERGFCLSIGEWQKDINGAGVPLVLSEHQQIYALNLGGPAYLLPADRLVAEYGPALVEAARTIAAAVTFPIAASFRKRA